jgi:hypothetical protein
MFSSRMTIPYTPQPDIYRYIVSVDIGIHHLALVLIETPHDYRSHDVVWFELIDITRFVHLDDTSKRTCTIPHTRTVSDWLSHVFYLYHELFALADHILIERQPPGGQIAVEQLFFFQYRSKAILIHPNTVHAFFGWHGDRESDSEIRYQHRKEKSMQVLRYRLAQTARTWLGNELCMYTRQHDIADAYCQAVYFTYRMHVDARRQQTRWDPADPLERFRFKLELDV